MPTYLSLDRCIRKAWCSFRKYTLEFYGRPSAPLELRTRMLRAEVLETIMLYGCVIWSPRACHYAATRCAESTCIGWRKNNRTDHPISLLDTLTKNRSGIIEAIMRRNGICGAHGGHETAEWRSVWRAGGGRRLRGGGRKKTRRVDVVSPGRPQSFRYQR